MTERDSEVKPATVFDEDDVSNKRRLDNSESKKQFYQRLGVWHSENYDGKRISETQKTKSDRKDIVNAVATQIELTDYQEQEAARAFTNLPDSYKLSHPASLVALCVCALIANEDGRGYHPHQLRHNSSCPNMFEQAADNMDFSYSEVYKCWSKLSTEIR